MGNHIEQGELLKPLSNYDQIKVALSLNRHYLISKTQRCTCVTTFWMQRTRLTYARPIFPDDEADPVSAD